jgi:murein endopeptidase
MRSMRSLVAAALALTVLAPRAHADAHRRPAHHAKATAPHKSAKARARILTSRARDHVEPRSLASGQSVGAPWDGRLQHPIPLPPGDAYHLRRPARAFGTQAAVELIQRAIGETVDAFPDVHVLAIGDLSAPSGGRITEHRSHQSGRDADIGLYYLDPPADYPASFVHADESNLDCEATFKLIERFAATADEDGGVQMIFLDFDVQGLLYDWALAQGVSERRLARIFQYPHGRGSAEGLVRHEPNHDNHMHVRFQCPRADSGCQ